MKALSAMLSLAFLTACGGATWPPLDSTALSAERAEQRQRAVAARDELAKTMLGELLAAMKEGGPQQAVEVCRTRAPAIAREVGERNGVRIGRTAVRLRNPGNEPPVWARDPVAAGTPTEALFAGTAGELGALFPIRLDERCLICHGAPEQIAEPVRAALREHYPSDRATGFAPGDLRGWFWVEVAPR